MQVSVISIVKSAPFGRTCKERAFTPAQWWSRRENSPYGRQSGVVGADLCLGNSCSIIGLRLTCLACLIWTCLRSQVSNYLYVICVVFVWPALRGCRRTGSQNLGT